MTMLKNHGETAPEMNGYHKGRVDVKERDTQMNGEKPAPLNDGESICLILSRNERTALLCFTKFYS